MKLLGIDPGLRNTGWGVIETDGNRIIYLGDGAVTSDPSLSLAERLVQLHDGLLSVIERFQPKEAAVEETFVNVNPSSTLKLGQARGIALFVPSKSGLRVSEYSPNLIKKSLVGSGHASKKQVQMMINTLLPGCVFKTADSADALATAICHAHHRKSSNLSKQLQELGV